MKLSKILLPFTLTSIRASAKAADPWPNRPIRFIFCFGPDGANDLMARAVAAGVSKANDE